MAKRELPQKMIDAQFKKGNSGRPKGSRNKVTVLREAVMAKAEDMVLKDWEDIVEATLKLAKQGDSACLKILWDRMVPAKRAEQGGGHNSKDFNVTIKVQRLENQSTDIVEADFEDIESSKNSTVGAIIGTVDEGNQESTH